MADTVEINLLPALPDALQGSDFLLVKRPGVAGLYRIDPASLVAAVILTLPTTLPAAPGKLWLNGGTFSVS